MRQEIYEQLVELLGPPQATLQTGEDPEAADYIEALWEVITDRTLADCVYGNPKGNLDFRNINRIRYNIKFLFAYLTKRGYPIAMAEWPWTPEIYERAGEFTFDDYEQIRWNYERAAAAFDLAKPRFIDEDEIVNYVDINNLEKVVAAIPIVLDKIEGSCFLVNEVQCGEA
mgnify:CR=1 FL=1